jgi:hypothetical protein
MNEIISTQIKSNVEQHFAKLTYFLEFLSWTNALISSRNHSVKYAEEQRLAVKVKPKKLEDFF